MPVYVWLYCNSLRAGERRYKIRNKSLRTHVVRIVVIWRGGGRGGRGMGGSRGRRWRWRCVDAVSLSLDKLRLAGQVRTWTGCTWVPNPRCEVSHAKVKLTIRQVGASCTGWRTGDDAGPGHWGRCDALGWRLQGSREGPLGASASVQWFIFVDGARSTPLPAANFISSNSIVAGQHSSIICDEAPICRHKTRIPQPQTLSLLYLHGRWTRVDKRHKMIKLLDSPSSKWEFPCDCRWNRRDGGGPLCDAWDALPLALIT